MYVSSFVNFVVHPWIVKGGVIKDDDDDVINVFGSTLTNCIRPPNKLSISRARSYKG
jgi:hypothetical protein